MAPEGTATVAGAGSAAELLLMDTEAPADTPVRVTVQVTGEPELTFETEQENDARLAGALTTSAADCTESR